MYHRHPIQKTKISGLKMYYIFDLDGTLSDDSHRAHFRTQEPKDWDAYNGACDKDTPIQEIIELTTALYTLGNDIEIWTGRTESEREKTETWLYAHDVSWDILRMRPSDDYRPANIVKLEWLAELPIKPTLVFEDRETQVKYWLDAGLSVLLLKRPHQKE